MSTLTDGQFQINANGVVLGTSQYMVQDVTGLFRDARSSDYERANSDGAIMGPDWQQPKTVTIMLTIVGTSPANTTALFDALAVDWNAARSTEGFQGTTSLRFQIPGRVTQTLIGGRPRRLEPNWATIGQSFLRVGASYYCPDPRIYGDVVKTATLTYNGAGVPITNAGNYPAGVVWAMGASTNPSVTRGVSSFQISAIVPAGLSFNVKTDNKTVVRSDNNGNQYATFSGPWLEIPAGTTTFSSAATSPTGTCIGTYRDTWI